MITKGCAKGAHWTGEADHCLGEVVELIQTSYGSPLYPRTLGPCECECHKEEAK